VGLIRGQSGRNIAFLARCEFRDLRPPPDWSLIMRLGMLVRCPLTPLAMQQGHINVVHKPLRILLFSCTIASLQFLPAQPGHALSDLDGTEEFHKLAMGRA